ncbi:glycosyltransferase family 39 protein [uncultured Rhodoblastus sp.]|uniref:ArnT family glycosyltransferase n=1 Tax=uncultured Rhodoblastus sp. TaxID=543037 RepID=UPI0025D7B4A4|nr:glycosyltransferase family 39 protein [uncultured Rhodoblastus sp.]
MVVKNPLTVDSVNSGWAPGLNAATDPEAQPWNFLARFLGLFVALVALLRCLVVMNVFLIQQDEGVWLHAAMRMSDGQILYRDFFEFHPPVGFLIVSGWTALFGPSLMAARILTALFISLTAWLAYDCCRIISGHRGLAASLALTWIAAFHIFWTSVNHHWFTSCFSMLTLWAIMTAQAKPGRLFLAGLAASAAALVTTSRGGLAVVAGLLSILSRRSVKDVLIYAAGGAALLFAVVGFLWSQGSLGPAIDQVIVWTFHNYSQIQGMPFGAFLDIQHLFTVAVFPLVAVLLAVAIAREGFGLLRRPHWIAASWFALAGFLGCFPRPDTAHITFGMVLALPLLCALVSVLLPQRWTSLAACAFVLIAIVLPFKQLLHSIDWVTHASSRDTRAGRVLAIPPNGMLQLIERLDTLPKQDSVFFYPFGPMVPYLTGRHHPARLDLLMPQFNTPSQFDQTCREIMAGAQWVVDDRNVNSTAYYRYVFPAMTDSSPPEKVAFEAALNKGFDLDASYGDYRLLRRGRADVSLCDPPAPAK